VNANVPEANGRIAFITTCRGRLQYLRRTLPTMLRAQPDEVVVVDYGCPQGTADWVRTNHPEVKVLHVTDDPGPFHLTRARNLGAAQTSAQWLVFIDADIEASEDWCAWMRNHLRRRVFYLAEKSGRTSDLEAVGTFICPREAFMRIEGFDEAYRGWGGEDIDIYRRLGGAGLASGAFPAHFVQAIHHGDDERDLEGFGDKKLRILATRAYAQAKYQLAFFRSANPPLAERIELMARAKAAVAEWAATDRSQPLVLRFTMAADRWVPAPYRMQASVQFSVIVSVADAKP
jgi:glycosyltransferase involved in cell wall biosynthesis